MPRDGSNIYSQPFPDVVEDTTIESTVYNGFTNDVAQDLNTARPIVAGGTGATNADQALVNLSGEKAAMLVTNYDNHVWQPGSFYSAAGATGAPTANAFSGIVYGSDPVATPPANQNVVLEARDVTDNRLYGRRKIAGVWSSAWASEESALDARYVNLTGDTMTGALIVNAAVTSNSTATTGTYNFGDGGTRYLTNDGTNFIFAGSPLVVGQTISSVISPTTGTYAFGNSGTKYLTYNGTNFVFAGAPLIVGEAIYSSISPTAGTYQFGTSGGKYLAYGGTNFELTGGPLTVNHTVYSANTTTTGTYQFGTSGTKNLLFDGTSFSLSGGNFALTTAASKFTAPNAVFTSTAVAGAATGWNSNSALCVENATTTVWPAAIKGTDRGTLYLITAASGIVSFFTQSTIGNNVGQISCTTTTTTYTTTSDGRKKPLREEFSGLEIINHLNPVRHNWINEPDRWDYGVIAQEAIEVLPQMVTRGDDNAAGKSGDDGFISWGADYSQAVPVLIRAVQELSKTNAELQARIEALETR